MPGSLSPPTGIKQHMGRESKNISYAAARCGAPGEIHAGPLQASPSGVYTGGGTDWSV